MARDILKALASCIGAVVIGVAIGLAYDATLTNLVPFCWALVLLVIGVPAVCWGMDRERSE